MTFFLNDWRNIHFAEPDKLQLLYVAAALFFISLIAWLTKLLLRPKRTHGSRYSILGTMKFWFSLSVVLSFCILAYARPFLAKNKMSVKRGSAEIIFIVDYSASMFLKDTGMARIDIAAREILNSLSGGIIREGDKASILVFGKIFLPRLPLTRDLAAIVNEAEKIGRPEDLLAGDIYWGTAAATTFKRAGELLDRQDMFAEFGGESAKWRPSTKDNRLIILLSDGDYFNYAFEERDEEIIELEKNNLRKELLELKKRNIPVYTIGIGTIGGARLTDILRDYERGKEYAPDLEKELEGQVSRLDTSNLNDISSATGGRSYSIENYHFDAANFIGASIDRHRSIRLEQIPGDEIQELWLFFLFGALTAFVSGMAVTKF